MKNGHTDRVATVGTLSGFQDFFLEPIIKDRPNKTEKIEFESCKPRNLCKTHIDNEIMQSMTVRD